MSVSLKTIKKNEKEISRHIDGIVRLAGVDPQSESELYDTCTGKLIHSVVKLSV